MKLNLLPKTVAKNVQSKMVFTIALVAVAASLALAIMYNRKLQGDLESYKTEATALEANAEKVRRTAQRADEIIADAAIVLTNSNLVNAIDAANTAYPDLYDKVKSHLPAFFRVRSMEAVSNGGDSCTVTLTGYLKTFQQYSDVMISLLRMEEVVSVARAGYGPVAPGNEGPFEYDPANPERGPIPGWSQVTLTLVVAKNLQAPDARETLQAAGAAAAGAGQPGGGQPGTVPAPGPGPGPGGRGGQPPGGGTGAS